MARGGVYTPQVVVNGLGGAGAGRAGGADKPRRSGRGRSDCRLFGLGAVGAGAAPSGGADVWLARYIPRTVEVAIPRGENAGHTLPYKDVVREMILLGKWRGEAAASPSRRRRVRPCRGRDRPRRRLRAGHCGGKALIRRAVGLIR